MLHLTENVKYGVNFFLRAWFSNLAIQYNISSSNWLYLKDSITLGEERENAFFMFLKE
jgi:hypothetical protein